MYLKLVCIYVKQEIICHIYEVPYMFHILYFRMGNFAIGVFCSRNENLAMQRILPETIC